MLASDLAGLYHAGGPRALWLYQIAQIVNRVGGYDPELLMGCPRIEAGPIPPRAGNVTMDSTAAGRRRSAYEPFDAWPVRPALVPTHRHWHYERDGRAGSPELLAEVLYRNPRLGAFVSGRIERRCPVRRPTKPQTMSHGPRPVRRAIGAR